MTYTWTLLGFDKKTEQLAFERAMPTMTAAAMRKIFSLPDTEPLGGGSMPVKTPEQIALLGQHIQGVDWTAFDYFIEPVED